MRKIIFLFIFILSFQQNNFAQNTYNIQVYKRDTAFSTIALDSLGNIYAGSIRRGIYKFDGTKWKDWTISLSVLGFRRSLITQMAGTTNGVWLTHNGYNVYNSGSGVTQPWEYANEGGGVNFIPASNPVARIQYRGRSIYGRKFINTRGPFTKAGLGIAVDKNGTVWNACNYADSINYFFYDANANVVFPDKYYYNPGGLSFKTTNMTNFDTVVTIIGQPNMPWPDGIIAGYGSGVGVYGTSGNPGASASFSIGKRRVARAVAVINSLDEVWVSMDSVRAVGEIFSNCILVYNLNGTFKEKKIFTGIGAPIGAGYGYIGATGIHEDSKQRKWITYGTKGFSVLDTTANWVYISSPPLLPVGTEIRTNGITSSKSGEVFFATNNGILVYKGKNMGYNADSSFSLITTSNGLSSNSVFSVTIDKNQNIWAATSLGVCKISRGDLNIYTLKPSSLINPITDNDNFRRLIATYDSKKSQVDIDKDTLFIAADGSKATIFKWTGSDPKNMKFRIKNQTSGNEFGSFQVKYLNPSLNDSIRLQYTHPTFIDELYTASGSTNGSRDLRLEIVDTVANPEVVVLEIPIKIVLPPVLMVHGLNSSGATWNDTKSTFLLNGIYKYLPYQISTPSYPNNDPFASNRNRIDGFITKLIENCGDNKMSVGKVDVVGHSMGGILSRLYLQGGVGATAYQKSIHKLITINTPHSGSPLANIVESIGNQLGWLGLDAFRIPSALNDLSIGKAPINVLLNGPSLNANVEPSHAIHSIDQFSGTTEAAFAGANFNQFTFLFKFWLASHTSCLQPFAGANACLSQIFGGASDLIVSDVSQTAGMVGNTQTLFPNLNHLNILKDVSVANRVLNLYRENVNTSSFSTIGFNPVMTLTWDPILGTQNRISSTDSVRIISPVYGATYNRGDSAFVTVRASNSIKRILFAMGIDGDISSFTIDTPDSLFRIKIPANAAGKINYKVWGFDAQGQQSITDSSYFQLGNVASVVLDSIKFSRVNLNDIPELTIGDSTIFNLKGYYSDNSTRNITNLSGVVYSNTTASISTSNLRYTKGLIAGFDELKATYLSKADTLGLEVVPAAIIIIGNPLPVRFTSITAEYNKDKVLVNWATAQELNNSHFIVEHCTDGRTFNAVGNVIATNNINGSQYKFVDLGYILGKNYYRIKQVDLDGKFSYSDIVLVYISVKGNVKIYPNPVSSNLIIDATNLLSGKNIIRISNTIGQVIFTQSLNNVNNKTIIPVDNFPTGIYKIELFDANENQIISEIFIKR